MTTPKNTPDFGEGYEVDYENPRSISEGLMLANASKNYTLLYQIFGELKKRKIISKNESGVEYYDGKEYGHTYFMFPNSIAHRSEGGDFGIYGGMGNMVQAILDGSENGDPMGELRRIEEDYLRRKK